MKRILVAVDFSEVTSLVVDMAIRMARSFGSEVIVIHVAEPDPAFVGFEAGPPSVRDAEAKHLREEHRQVQQVAEDIRAQGIQATGLVVQGATVQRIVDEVEKHDADLIIMGNHRHGPTYRFFLGSATEGVIRQNRCPVLVVPGTK
jgi:nucleotide-binding universal stress UspA family protein